MKRLLLCGVVAIYSLCLLCDPSWAQTSGTIWGKIVDPKGALVPGAGVMAKNENTGMERNVVSDESGSFLIPVLPPGVYSLEVRAPGFTLIKKTGLILTSAQNLRVDLVLQVGAISTTVTVLGGVTDVETHQASVTYLMDQKRLMELPLNGRSPASLVVLIPGTTEVSVPTRPGIAGIKINLNGSRADGQQFLLDGAPFNAVQRSDGNPLPPADIVQEFRVLANAYTAEFGRNAGGIFSTTTKSGTNELHGSAWEYLRNDKLNARNFFTPTVPTLRQNQFGFTIGGPVILPAYNGRNRTFFFASYQGTRIREVKLANTAKPPTTAERQGDFSKASIQIKDPTTGQPFQNNSIPSSRFDPAAVKVIARLPLANTADGRFQRMDSQPTNADQILAKFDHQISNANRISFKYWYDKEQIVDPWPLGNELPWSPGVFKTLIQTADIGDTHVFSPVLLNSFRFAFTRRNEERYNLVNEDASAFGIKIMLPSQPVLPSIRATGRFFLVPQINGSPVKLDNTFALSDAFSIIKGRHNLKLGMSLEKPNFYGRSKSDNGAFVFSGQITGDPVADLLLGIPVSFTQGVGNEADYSSKYWGFFVQDDFKLTDRLTLNLGLRYQYDTPTVHNKDRIANLNLGARSARFPQAPQGLVYAGDAGYPRSLYQPDRNNLAPRIGVAWDVTGDGKTSVRAGYGIFYQVICYEYNSFLGQNQPFVGSVSLSNPYSLSNPWGTQYQGGVNDPLSQYVKGVSSFFTPTQAYSLDPAMRNGYVQQYSLSVQRQLPWDTLFEIAYVGNSARKLGLLRELNPGVYGPGATVSNIDQRRPILPGTYRSIWRFEGSSNSSYNSLQTSINKRFSQGWGSSIAYTYAKVIDFFSGVGAADLITDPGNLGRDRGPADFDRTHVFSGSLVWEIPAFKANPNPLVRYILGGWQTAGLWRLMTGLPVNVRTGRDNSLTGNGRDRPDTISNPELSSDRPRSEKILKYFDTGAFQPNAAGTFGNTGRNTLRGPGFANVDFSLMKDFRIKEQHRIQFRAEFFNVFNLVNFGNPTSSYYSSNFGRILSAYDPRLVQFGLKYSF